MQGEMTEGEVVQPVECEDEKADASKSPQRANPERSSERRISRQAIGAPGTMLDSGQYDCRNRSGDKISQLLEQHVPQATRTEIPRSRPTYGQLLQRIIHGQIKRESPAWA